VILAVTLWLVPAASVVLPFRRFIFADAPAWSAWPAAAILAALWPLLALALARKHFVFLCVSDQARRASRLDI
jgi:hypothetical protein